MIGKLNLPAHLQPGSTPTILVANPVKSFCDRTNATARSMVFAPRDERAKFYPDRQWNNGFIGNSYAGYAFAIPAVLVTSLTQQ
ncbi:hypothetical protein ACOJBM_06000 [Rhizobium beringeri]